MADGTFPPGMVPPPAAPVSSQVLERGTLSFLSLPAPALPLSISDSARLRSAAYASCDPAGRPRAATASLQRATAATNAAAAAELQQLRTARPPATVSTRWPPVWLWVPTANAHGLPAAADGNDGLRWISAPRYANGGRGDAGGVQAASAAASSCRAQGARR